MSAAKLKRKGGRKNPEELLIYGAAKALAGINPSRKRRAKRRNAGTTNHKPGCACFACKFKRGEKASPAKRKNGRRSKAGKPFLDGQNNPSRRRRNAVSESDQAVKLFQSFHGKDPKEIVEEQRSAAMRLDYTALGDLDYILVELASGEVEEINFEADQVKLASSANGKQLYCIGGNQNLNGVLDKFTDDTSKDLFDLGEAMEVQYRARKAVGNFEPIAWFHKFGEEGGQPPRLGYDKLRQEVFFIGGEYHVEPEGITN